MAKRKEPWTRKEIARVNRARERCGLEPLPYDGEWMKEQIALKKFADDLREARSEPGFVADGEEVFRALSLAPVEASRRTATIDRTTRALVNEWHLRRKGKRQGDHLARARQEKKKKREIPPALRTRILRMHRLRDMGAHSIHNALRAEEDDCPGSQKAPTLGAISALIRSGR